MLRELVAVLARGGVKAKEASGRLAQALEEPDPGACFALAWKALFTDKDEPRKQLGKVDAVPAAQQALEELADQVRQHEARAEHLRMVRLTRVLLTQYAEFKRARGLADMADLERCALELLADSEIAGWMQERLDARVRHVLIDEFQDTSPLQWHALHAWLSSYAGAGGGASGQRPPGVFIVGDPKQSIYRFRGAEPRVFEAAREFVVQGLGGQLLACDHTRRNAPAVVGVLNEVFGLAQRERDFAGFRPHTTEVETSAGPGLFVLPRVPRPGRDDKVAGPQEAWRDSLTVPRHEPEEVLREQEARQVAGAIRQLVADGLAPGDIQVLCRKRESLRLVADALAACHVPFAAAEDSELLQAPEARDLLALLDALVSPQHRLSLAHALKSPVFGATDGDLLTLARAAQAHHGDWWRTLQKLEYPSAALQRARVLLARWRDAADALPPHDLLDMIVHEGELHERLAAVVPAERRTAALAVIDGVLHQALTLDGARHATPYNFVRALKRRKLKLPAALQPGAVQLLTVHGAKGLEAQVVFVVDSDPERKPAECATLLVDWPVHSEHPLHCAFIYSESQRPPSLEHVLEAEIAARRREEMNGLYVAMTRARGRLVFSATEPAKEGDGPSWWQRVQAHAVPWPEHDVRPAAASAHAPSPVVHVLPRLSRVRVPAKATVAADDGASRLGEAVHRVLEWAAAPGADVGASLSAHAAAAAREFGAPAEEVERLAAGIWSSQHCGRFFRGDAIVWACNEVPVPHAGEPLRIDRLVLMEEDHGRVWWVLDYKLQHTPEAVPAYRDQLRRYREAVQQLQPGERVRCAFITGQGGLVELD
jgi:ATP-dependent helicase/nuclease subunit A